MKGLEAFLTVPTTYYFKMETIHSQAYHMTITFVTFIVLKGFPFIYCLTFL